MNADTGASSGRPLNVQVGEATEAEPGSADAWHSVRIAFDEGGLRLSVNRHQVGLLQDSTRINS